jgi:hypothetical protein
MGSDAACFRPRADVQASRCRRRTWRAAGRRICSGSDGTRARQTFTAHGPAQTRLFLARPPAQSLCRWLQRCGAGNRLVRRAGTEADAPPVVLRALRAFQQTQKGRTIPGTQPDHVGWWPPRHVRSLRPPCRACEERPCLDGGLRYVRFLLPAPCGVRTPVCCISLCIIPGAASQFKPGQCWVLAYEVEAGRRKPSPLRQVAGAQTANVGWLAGELCPPRFRLSPGWLIGMVRSGPFEPGF